MDYSWHVDCSGCFGFAGAADCYQDSRDQGAWDQGKPGNGKADAGRAWAAVHAGAVHFPTRRGTEDDSAGSDRDDASYRGRERG